MNKNNRLERAVKILVVCMILTLALSGLAYEWIDTFGDNSTSGLYQDVIKWGVPVILFFCAFISFCVMLKAMSVIFKAPPGLANWDELKSKR